jgi:hypothetical protein
MKTDLFDCMYFLCNDRIARDVAHQLIIVDELRRHGKRIIINGKDYEENPEKCVLIWHLARFQVGEFGQKVGRC